MKTSLDEIVFTTIFRSRYMTDEESAEALKTWAKVGAQVVISCDPERTVRTVVGVLPHSLLRTY